MTTLRPAMRKYTKRMLKRSVFVLLTLTILAQSLAPVALAQDGNWWEPSYKSFAEKVQGSPPNEIFGERYTHAQVSWIINSFLSLAGGDAAECAGRSNDSGGAFRCFLDIIKLGQGQLRLGPALAAASASDRLYSTRITSGVEYVAYKLDEISPTANAQSREGFGFSNSLRPISLLWVAVRNVTLALMTFAIIIVAFMIMLRTRISPQAVVNVQYAIPQIAISLIFITFSFPIAGFIMDLGYVLLGLLVSSLKVFIPGLTSLSVVDLYTQINNGVVGIFAYGFSFILEALSGAGVFARVFRLNIPGTEVNITSIPGLIIDPIIALIVIVLLVIVLVRTFWLILKTQITIFFLTAGAPIFGLVNIVSPGKGVLGTWARLMFANMLVFVTIGAFIFLAHVLFFGLGNGGSLLAVVFNLVEEFLQPLFGSGNTGLDLVNPYAITSGVLGQGGSSGGGVPGGYGTGRTEDIGFFASLTLLLALPGLSSAVRDYVKGDRPGHIPTEAPTGAALAGGLVDDRLSRRQESRIAQSQGQGVPPEEAARDRIAAGRYDKTRSAIRGVFKSIG